MNCLHVPQYADDTVVLIRPTAVFVKKVSSRIFCKSPINFDRGHTLAAIVVATVEQNR